MSRTRFMGIGAVVAAVALGAGYWLGRETAPAASAPTGITSANSAAAPSAQPGSAGKKVLYYRNPMGLPDTSPTPKKDSMGMDYIPVYEGEEPAAGGSDIRISPDRVQKLGVRVQAASRRDLARAVRAAGRVEPDERRTYAITPRFEGWVEKLFVNATGQPVTRGQPLFEVYSPELVAVQREYAIAARGQESLQDSSEDTRSAMRQLANASLTRMRNWELPEEQIEALKRGAELKRSVTFRSPVSGIVSERKALQGMRFMPGDTLYQIVDLSSVWVIADVFEQDLGLVKPGAMAKITINAYPDRAFSGKVTYIYPNLNAETRTIPVRVELVNSGMLLKPGMYASVELAGSGRARALTVPNSAVIDSGLRRVVLVQTGEGRFAPRDVKLGMRSDDYVEVLEGVNEGDMVVTAANFLIDAESNLKAALGTLSGSPGAPVTPGAPSGGTGKVGHQAKGKLDAVDAKAGTATISHGPIESLKWPSMTMEFTLAHPGQANAIKTGTPIEFEFVERAPGTWVITKIAPAGGSATSPPPAPAAPAPAAGHKH